ncbi:SAM-dependent methyltransferase [Virgibacillus phasianinus]|uniref:SAM-dependent methyltransferase n=1 Tax=Virgibacillus phasianinus TaxID=2017483 RepID=A0A220U3U5_9BACI|nr:class I SAM-dependent methyltransferase [Virgibacillus phasianinus]ASK62770.1 SAM-dependent methyltransferase [Virgibacillus phasianinus]
MLKDTGERVIPEKMKITNDLLLEHVARYHFAINYSSGRVLDFASGSGYGSHIIAKKCKDKGVTEVIGVDNDKDAIAYGQYKYYHPLTTFLHGDVTASDLPEKLGQFDTILSFETIEHIPDEKQFLSNIYAMLKPGGTLLLSTPFGKGRGVPCGSPFHVHQLTIGEFKQLFVDYRSSAFYLQKGVLITPETLRDEEDYYPLGIAVCEK